MRKALTGVSNNVARNIDKIKVWAHSFEKHTDGDAVLIAADMTEGDKLSLETNNIKYFEVKTDQNLTINDSRLIHTANWIEQSEYDLFMVTDVFDVCFQGDPFEMMDTNSYDFFAASEGILHREEPWNMDVMRKAFPEYGDFIRPFEVVCSGVMGGKKSAMSNVLRKQQELVDGALHGHDIRDQAALNILIYKNQIENLKIFKPNDGWAVHCSLAGPTFQHIEWGLGNVINGRYGLPKLHKNVLLTSSDKMYAIAHQYNRIPEWNKKIIAQYV
jgi:hypothetical protein